MGGLSSKVMEGEEIWVHCGMRPWDAIPHFSTGLWTPPHTSLLGFQPYSFPSTTTTSIPVLHPLPTLTFHTVCTAGSIS